MFNNEFLKKYSILKKLGTGTTSSVFKVLAVDSRKVFTCKQIKHRKYTAIREINVLRKLPNDPRFPQYKESIENDDIINIVMSHKDGKELFEWFIDILESDIGNISEQCVKNIFIQMVKSVKDLHDAKLCHLDIKLENFIVSTDSKNTISIIDFGAAHSFFRSKTALSKIVGTMGYAPYETYKGEYCHTSDSWSLGVCLWTLLTKTKPFTHIRSIEPVSEDDFDFPTLGHLKMKHMMTPAAFDLINKLLINDPMERLCVNDILEHKWLSCKEDAVSINT